MTSNKVEYQKILSQIQNEFSDTPLSGKVASYIPELAKVPSNKFGMHLYDLDGESHCFGDSNERFSIQSISKVFTLSLAMKMVGDKLWNRVGVDRTGAPFNSLSILSNEAGNPAKHF